MERNKNMKDCRTCKYGYKDERLGIPMCHHPKRFSEDCVDFNMHEEKETEESEKSMDQDELEKEIDRMWNPRFNLGWDDNSLLSINHKSFEAIARHFAQWGAENLKK